MQQIFKLWKTIIAILRFLGFPNIAYITAKIVHKVHDANLITILDAQFSVALMYYCGSLFS